VPALTRMTRVAPQRSAGAAALQEETKLKAMLFIATLFTAVACNAQEQVASPTAMPGKAAKPVKEKRICRQQNVTGSIMSKSVCHTAAQWNAIDAANGAELEHFQSHSSGL
jgi:hypothetical protein